MNDKERLSHKYGMCTLYVENGRTNIYNILLTHHHCSPLHMQPVPRFFNFSSRDNKRGMEEATSTRALLASGTTCISPRTTFRTCNGYRQTNTILEIIVASVCMHNHTCSGNRSSSKSRSFARNSSAASPYTPYFSYTTINCIRG